MSVGLYLGRSAQGIFVLRLYGSGLGTFHYAYLPFQNPMAIGWYYHAESLYAQALVELGWIGGLAIVSLLGIAIVHLYRLSGPEVKPVVRTRMETDDYRSIFLVGLTLVLAQGIHAMVISRSSSLLSSFRAAYCWEWSWERRGRNAGICREPRGSP